LGGRGICAAEGLLERRTSRRKVQNTITQLNYQDSVTYKKKLFWYWDYPHTFMKKDEFLK